MEQITSYVAKGASTAISSSWAIFVAATVALFLFFFGDAIGLEHRGDRGAVAKGDSGDPRPPSRADAGGARSRLGDLRGAREQVIDASHERIGIERLRHDDAEAESREGPLGTIGHGREEQNWNVDE